MTVQRSALTTQQARAVLGRHRARQVRAHIVALAQEYKEAAQEYKEAAQQHEEIAAYVLRLNVEAPAVLREEEERTWEQVEQRREALFGALGEVERVEDEGR